MSTLNLGTCKKRKKSYNFHTFCKPGCDPVSRTGPFRDNIRVFLQQCAELQDYKVEGMFVWCTFLAIESQKLIIPLYTIEEDVKKSLKPYCDHCRCNDWRINLVSKRKYHMIIPVDSEWSYKLKDGVFGLRNHLLYGLIHCNGFGHLVCTNGREGGSKILYGREIMDLWDRICTNLQTGKISVRDVSKKHSMDLRLLNGIAEGYPWFGRWGYKFFYGSFGDQCLDYSKAIEKLSSLTLDEIIQDFSDKGQNKRMKEIIDYYKDLSGTQLITFKDLLMIMFTLMSSFRAQKKQSMTVTATSKPPVKGKSVVLENYKSHVANLKTPINWPQSKVEHAADVIVETLKEKKADKVTRGMSRKDLIDAIREHNVTGVVPIDYVLKSMEDVILERYVFRRGKKPETGAFVYWIEELSDGIRPLEPRIDVNADLVYMYENVLFNYPKRKSESSKVVKIATRTILNSKHFVKEWQFRHEKDQLLVFICPVIPKGNGPEANIYSNAPPGELVLLPSTASFLELKQAAERALRDTYCMLDRFSVTTIEHMENLDDKDLVFDFIKSGAEIFVKGHGTDLNSPLRHEGGADNQEVKCDCGADDDDGERMIKCDICEVWQHTRCSSIDDNETISELFVCEGCYESITSSTEPKQVLESFDDPSN